VRSSVTDEDGDLRHTRESQSALSSAEAGSSASIRMHIIYAIYEDETDFDCVCNFVPVSVFWPAQLYICSVFNRIHNLYTDVI